MDDEWVRLGAAVREAREALGLKQAQLGEAVGVGATTIANIERARTRAITSTLRSVARVLGWPSDGIETLLAGGELPAPSDDVDIVLRDGQGETRTLQMKTYGAPEGMPLRVARALAEGATLDTTIVPLGPGADMVVVVKGKPTASPEELRAALLAWEQREGHLDRLGLTADDQDQARGET
jgi:transcriptional regulator with XRE-family HTH domain